MSVDREIAMMAGGFVGTVVVVLAPILIGYAVASKMNKNKEYSEGVRGPVIAGCVISLLMLLGQCSAKDRQNASSSEDNAVEVIDGQKAEAFPDDVDPQSLEAFRAELTKTIEAEYRDEWGELDSEIATARFGGKTVVIFNAKGSLGSVMTQNIGVINGKKKVVVCFSRTGERVAGCDKKVVEVFGQPSADQALVQ